VALWPKIPVPGLVSDDRAEVGGDVGALAVVVDREGHRVTPFAGCGLDGQTPASVFAAVERDALMPLPPGPFESVAYSLGRVAPDCHVKSGKALYSVPWRLIGQQVTVRSDSCQSSLHLDSRL
jgi:hypothetical protein